MPAPSHTQTAHRHRPLPDASTCESDAGLRARCNAGADTTSVYAFATRGNNGIPNTSSPGLNSHVPGACSTTPLMSRPRTNGSGPTNGNSRARRHDERFR